ncbi:histidine phosphatase family protein [Paractinoplanes lichenicola]|uniref:Histidine phosphatase family protein n=1 Tax=Paractinoplanes lichenicola TaxID=2802976 RepID=A0ABS1VTM7_9ACTN|nr:histidine phosphatase family protein [Actinoplanes lichenicola]MBL7257822.1 histidine phosphatase family protein [Actinoplanes lichenicola]
MIRLGSGSAATEPVRLILVRHAMPVTDPAIPPHRWRLAAPVSLSSPPRDHPARPGSSALPRGAYLVASSETKAAQTLSFDRPLPQDAGFDEVRRPHEWRDDHRERARAYVEGLPHPGWEPHAAVVARFEAALARHAELAAGRALVVGTHGMAMTCWLWSRALVTDPGSFWAALRFPDVIEV